MSSDNAILVGKYRGEYYVWYASGDSDYDIQPPNMFHASNYKKFSMRADALLYAHDLDNERHTEHGVQEIDFDARYEASLQKIHVPCALKLEKNDILYVDIEKRLVRVERQGEYIYRQDNKH